MKTPVQFIKSLFKSKKEAPVEPVKEMGNMASIESQPSVPTEPTVNAKFTVAQNAEPAPTKPSKIGQFLSTIGHGISNLFGAIGKALKGLFAKKQTPINNLEQKEGVVEFTNPLYDPSYLAPEQPQITPALHLPSTEQVEIAAPSELKKSPSRSSLTA